MTVRSTLMALLALCSCAKSPVVEPPPNTWQPGTVYRTERALSARGFLDRRGLIHSHSYYSHDACDGQPRDDAGVYNEPCLDDFRRGLCQSQHDFAFLTDHPSSFTDVEFPDALLYRPARGDTLVDHGSGPTANWLTCPDAPPALVMAGTESSPMMPVGLESHAAEPGARRNVYDSEKADALVTVKEHGAVALVAHTERWTPDQLTTLPLDGFEMYNLHANTFKNLQVVADLMLKVDAKQFDGLPHPDLLLAAYVLEDPAYLETWGTTLSRGSKRVTTMGTDCHRNSLPQIAQDGERLDSYRRMMISFSNHLLVKPKTDGTWDDRDLKDALRAGRLYGAFEFMGYPVGFDYFAEEGGQLKEMGDEVSAASGVTLQVTRPTLQNAPAGEAAVLTMRVLKARDAGWDEVATGTEATLRVTITEPGAYRAEVRLVPAHLKPWIGRRRDWLSDSRPWVYSNAIYVK